MKPEVKERPPSDLISRLVSEFSNIAKLLTRLIRDPRVPPRNKVIAGCIAAYLLLPVDFIPDSIPGVGQLDDIVMLALAVDLLVNNVPDEIVAEHWDGERAVLDMVRGVTATVTTFVPDRVRDVLLPR
ncbi:MAG TPA: DUF1232 domain-containing protein [Actinomycetota bacterium]|jgi:uncharacterized membrane protein YkvA (DUF1232 family)|nr:DUF1232 domain-containing protein [Actinomycetota bacterium]